MMRFGVLALWCCVMFGRGESRCNDELVTRSNVTAELQSDVLLPCNFHPTLLGRDETADVSVVWTQRNTSVHNLLEISIQGDVSSWDYRDGRIKTFPKLSQSGDFSILLQKVQMYDVSLYRCHLYKGFNCSVAYQEIQLGLGAGLNQAIVTGASAGAAFLLLFVACVFYIGKTRKHRPHPDLTHGSVVCPYDNPIYESYSVPPGPDADEALVGETTIYEVV